MKPAILVAYLNRPTRDGRIITSLDLTRDSPWPIVDARGNLIGRVDTLEFAQDGCLFAVDYTFDRGDPDWGRWCLTISLADIELHSIGAHAHMKMSGRVAGFQLSPATDWPWGPRPQRRFGPTRPDPRLATVASTLRTIADWPLADMTRDELLSLADAVERLDSSDGSCPICEEALCDDGCPLEGLRAP